MRMLPILLLTVLVGPFFAHAAEPPALSSYSVSNDTIYPGAAAASGLATTSSIDTAFSEQVKVSIKIVSGDTVIKSLYSSSAVTNPAAKIWDGTDASGTGAEVGVYAVLIMATSTATGLSLRDTSKTITVAAPRSPDAGIADPEDQAAPVSASSPPEYAPVPTLRVLSEGSRTVSAGADTAFAVQVYDGKGNRRVDALVTWSFGDGMRRTGASVYHAYLEPGEYAAVVHATTADGGDTRAEMVITVKRAGVRITSVTPRGVTLSNEDSRSLDLSRWRIFSGGKAFTIPEDTQILAGRSILFPAQVTDLPAADSAALLLPSGEAVSMWPVAAQPAAAAARYESVQEAEPPAREEPITSTRKATHADEISAPREPANTPVSRGATLPEVGIEVTAAVADAPKSGVLRSPWTLSFLGLMALAGTAFIFL